MKGRVDVCALPVTGVHGRLCHAALRSCRNGGVQLHSWPVSVHLEDYFVLQFHFDVSSKIQVLFSNSTLAGLGIESRVTLGSTVWAQPFLGLVVLVLLLRTEAVPDTAKRFSRIEKCANKRVWDAWSIPWQKQAKPFGFKWLHFGAVTELGERWQHWMPGGEEGAAFGTVQGGFVVSLLTMFPLLSRLMKIQALFQKRSKAEHLVSIHLPTYQRKGSSFRVVFRKFRYNAALNKKKKVWSINLGSWDLLLH